MLNKEIYTLNPEQNNLANDGVVEINAGKDDPNHRLLRFELQTFVCEGEYQRGIAQILSQYLNHLSSAKQPAVWVSGFFGSGKSHLVKMLGNLWQDFAFEDGKTARTVKPMPQDISDLLAELELKQKMYGRLAIMASLKDSSAKDIRYKFVQLLLEALELPIALHQFRFIKWLRDEGITGQVEDYLTKKGKSVAKELTNMFVSQDLFAAIVQARPGFAQDTNTVMEAIKRNFEKVETLGKKEFLDVIKQEILPWKFGDKIPCTLIILDEVQQFISNDPQQSLDVQNLAEELSSSFDGKFMVIGTGQNALSDVALLMRLQDRFSVKVNLTNTDVETVTRKTILDKKASAIPAIQSFLEAAAGEIDQLLHGTNYGAITADKNTIVADYPVLPPVRKFWKRLLMHLDKAGTAGQLRSQLRIVNDSVKATAAMPLGRVVPGDFVFGQKQSQLLANAVLLNETNEVIVKRLQGNKEEHLEGRILSAVFLIDQFRDDNASDRLKSNAATIADLLLDDLTQPAAPFRTAVENAVKKLLDENLLMPVGDEVKLQTKAGQEWEQDFRQQQQKLNGSGGDQIQRLRRERLSAWFNQTAKGIAIFQGKARQKREHEIWDKSETPDSDIKLHLWLRDGWSESEKTLLDEIRAAGTDKPLSYVFAFATPTQDAQLKKEAAAFLAAQSVLERKGAPATPEGEQARKSMETRKNNAQKAIELLIEQIASDATIYMAGGTQVSEDNMRSTIQEALNNVANRQFTEYTKADVQGWDRALTKALSGAPDAIQAIGFSGEPHEHPVAAEILRFIGNSTKQGKDIQQAFVSSPYGWPLDAVDAMLLMLVLAQNISATEQIKTRSQIRNATFKRETHTLSTGDKLALRKLFTMPGISCPPGREFAASSDFLQELLSLAQRASGDAPRPEPISTSQLSDLLHLDGTERLSRIVTLKVQLTQNYEQWKNDAETIGRREPDWRLLNNLLNYAPEGTAFADIRQEVAAIRSNRLLLNEPDTVAPLLQKLTDALNAALQERVQEYLAAHKAHMEDLAASGYWEPLPQETRHAILSRASLTNPPKVQHLNATDLLNSLQNINLSAWRNKIDALPQQFANARAEALKEAEPKAKSFRAPSRTIRNQAELDTYLADLKTTLTQLLSEGHIVDLN